MRLCCLYFTLDRIDIHRFLFLSVAICVGSRSVGITLYYLATGVLPYSSSSGYWGIVKSIRDEPAPRLPDNNNQWSPAFHHLIEACLQKDPDQRWTAKQLCQHPFFNNHEQIWQLHGGVKAHLVLQRNQADYQDLIQIIDVLIHHFYIQTGQTYKRSLFEIARYVPMPSASAQLSVASSMYFCLSHPICLFDVLFLVARLQRIVAEMDVSLAEVQETFESRYQYLMSQPQ